MTDEQEIETEEQFAGPEPKSSGAVISAIKRSEHEFRSWQRTCHLIDDIYSLHGDGYGIGYGGDAIAADGFGWQDTKLDMFWASYEILKPAVYAKPPVPAVVPMFQDNRQLYNVAAELLERVSISTFKACGIDDVMTEVRDDLLFAGRGVLWLIYEKDSDGQRVLMEHLDRTDFAHEPARKWSEVGWVARRAWMTRKEMRKRFFKTSGNAYQNAQFKTRRDAEDNKDSQTLTKKAGVWEVWHKVDKKVYWVTEGVDVLLDSGAPHLSLSEFWPCPRPAFGTLRRRSLIPVPDWERYAIHFQKISTLTGRIYLLLEKVRMKGLIPAGGDVGDAVEELIRSDDDEILIPVPGAALLAGGASGFVQWLPLKDVAEAIQGLIGARAQLIDDFYQLSGISDIMRGATEAEETLGAQQLKTQYGSVRVRCKIDELQRVAADAVKIAAEIIAENFSQETLLEMSQMEIHTRASIERRVDDINAAAEQEMEALGQKVREQLQQARQGGEVDPAQAQQMLQQAQQQIVQKYAPMLMDVEQQVPIEDVMKLLRDSKARGFTFEIETDSTILTDEMQEKASRNEFVQAFTAATQGLMGMAAMGEQGATLAGEVMKFQLAPYRAGRQLSGAIDKFIDAAPEMAAKAAAAAGQAGGDSEALAEANKTLAAAEMEKARAAITRVEADSANKQAENERKMFELQQKTAADRDKFMTEMEKLRQSEESNRVKASEAVAKVDNLRAQTIKLLSDASINVRSQSLDEFKSLADIEFRASDQAMAADETAADRDFRERGESRADRQQEFTETQALSEGDE